MLFPKFSSGLIKCVWNCIHLIYVVTFTIIKDDNIPENIIQYLQFKLIFCILD